MPPVALGINCSQLCIAMSWHLQRGMSCKRCWRMYRNGTADTLTAGWLCGTCDPKPDTAGGVRERLEGSGWRDSPPLPASPQLLSKVWEPEETACLRLMLSSPGVGGLTQCALIHFIVRYHRCTTATMHSQEELPCPTLLNYIAPPGGRCGKVLIHSHQ